MMVRYTHKVVRRTCGSIRSSLAASARLVTVWSKAAVTTPNFHFGSGRLCEELVVTASIDAVNGIGWMTCPTKSELPQASSTPESQRCCQALAKTATQSAAPSDTRGTWTLKTAGV